MSTLKTNPKVDHYLIDGCGRCKLYATPKCKVNTWRNELEMLRQIVLGCNIQEDVKWSMPVYTINGKNVLMIAAFKDYCALSFFKGALLKDPYNILAKHGESSQAFRLFKFTNVKDIEKLSKKITSYIIEAIELEKKGAKIEFKKTIEKIPEELELKFKEMPSFKKAFFALTPGRQRGYILHFSQAKQSATRVSRIEKQVPNIMKGRGLNE
ncbi:MAG: YdeI/OmpD-associated family protein [Sphingobacteriaceae bacterium]|jgi:uncharacterized protein YdeI (YjbR/CyaY-like superfamily)